MAKPLFAYPLQDEWDFEDVGDELGSLPRSNLSTESPEKKWRTSGLTDVKFRIDLGASTEVNLIGLFHHNGTPGLPSSGPTWRIRADDTEANLDASPGSEAYDSGDIPLLMGSVNLSGWTETNSFLYLGGSSQTLRYWEVLVEDTSNPDGYFEAGRAYLSLCHQPSSGGLNFAGQPRPIFREDRVWKTTEAGTKVPAIRPRDRYAEPRILIDGSGGDTEYAEGLFEMYRVRGSSQSIFYVFDPDDARANHYSFYGLVSDFRESEQFNRISVTVRMEEYKG